jgi:hypothetical protein
MSIEKAADYFSRHKASNECHITSDERVFHTRGTADSFASGLKENTVTSYTREQIEALKVETDKLDPEDENELRFKQRVNVLTGLGFERLEDEFINSEDNSSISVTDVYNSTDEVFAISITPVIKKVEIPKDDSLKLDLKIADDTLPVDPLALLNSFNSETATYEDAKAVVKALKIETPSKKQADLFAAIENQKIILNHEVKQ